jgi:L-alanine-DL-glutamate epimerase-like enolase superfamily enzyme
MKIVNIEHWTENLELTRPYTIAYKTISSVKNHFVRIDTEDGLFGIGSASPSVEVTGESIDDCGRALEAHLEPLLLGQDVHEWKSLFQAIETAMPSAPAARAAVNIALHDLAAKRLKLPLAEMLGRVHKSLPTSITIGIQSIEESLREAKEYIARGFWILKVKIGSSLEEDLELLKALRGDIGRKVIIRVDVNQAYSSRDFMEFFHKAEFLDLEFVEQPLPASEVDAMRRLPEEVRRISAADESLLGLTDAVNMAESPQPFGIYTIKLMKCGGVSTAGEIAKTAQAAGIDLMWGCNDESIVSISAALHAALASPATRYLDLDGSLDLARDVVKGGFILNQGELTINDNPGLGVELI